MKARYRLDEFPRGFELFKFEFENPFTKEKITKTRIFIPSLVVDNPHLPPSYVANLFQSGSEELVRMWVEGDWSVTEGAFFDGWSSKNIVEPFAIPPDCLKFRSMDWGSSRPFSIGWWAVASDDYPLEDGRVIPRGAMIRYREWYGASSPNVGLKLTLEEVANGMIERSGDEQFAWTVVDPSMFAQSGGPSLGERMMRCGVDNLKRGDNRRVPLAGAMGGWDQMRARIRGDGERPMLFVFCDLRAFIQHAADAAARSSRAEDVDTERRGSRSRTRRATPA